MFDLIQKLQQLSWVLHPLLSRCYQHNPHGDSHGSAPIDNTLPGWFPLLNPVK
jgi:hypothetical protein